MMATCPGNGALNIVFRSPVPSYSSLVVGSMTPPVASKFFRSCRMAKRYLRWVFSKIFFKEWRFQPYRRSIIDAISKWHTIFQILLAIWVHSSFLGICSKATGLEFDPPRIAWWNCDLSILNQWSINYQLWFNYVSQFCMARTHTHTIEQTVMRRPWASHAVRSSRSLSSSFRSRLGVELDSSHFNWGWETTKITGSERSSSRISCKILLILLL